jgi:hypothetical protein
MKSLKVKNSNFFKFAIKTFSSKITDEEKLKRTLEIIQKIKNNEINKLKPKEMNILKYNEYKIVLAKSIYSYKKIKFQKSIKKNVAYFLVVFSSLLILKLFSQYYLIYYWFNWDIDLRNPKVSDYIIERFR